MNPNTKSYRASEMITIPIEELTDISNRALTMTNLSEDLQRQLIDQSVEHEKALLDLKAKHTESIRIIEKLHADNIAEAGKKFRDRGDIIESAQARVNFLLTRGNRRNFKAKVLDELISLRDSLIIK